MSNPKIIIQTANFLNKMNIPFTSVKMFGKMLMINTPDIQSAELIQSILNGSGLTNVGFDGEQDRYHDDYAVVGLVDDENLEESEE